jgi:release factor glutamine methyltransferase
VTIRDAFRLAIEHLSKQGLSTSREDAELLVCAVAGVDRAQLFAHPERVLSRSEQMTLEQWVERRGRKFPVQYLIGRQEFYGRKFQVTPSVLIPRPETELLVETSLELMARLCEPIIEVLDVGVGSGCIAISLACEEPRVIATGIDISERAVAVARQNAAQLGCASRVSFLVGDTLDPVKKLRRRFHLIVSNPPYVENESSEVDPSVKRYEPAEAVFAGPTGLEIYVKIFEGAAAVLRRPGWLVLEMGYGAHEGVATLAAKAGWRMIEQRRDLAGIPRCAVFELAS